jgi:mannonate dehydratase
MKPTWRWFGPNDPITLPQIRQAGATGVVTALHGCAPGEVWPQDEIEALKAQIKEAGLTWDVCESIWMPDAIKLHGDKATEEIDAWVTTLHHLSEAGVKTICYNFMPLLDWTRTDLAYSVLGRGRALRFDMIDFIVYDVHVLARPNAEKAYSAAQLRAAAGRAKAMDAAACAALESDIIAGLPGSAMGFTSKDLRAGIASFSALSHDDLRANLAAFLAVVVPHATALGVKLAIHPDDPPMPLFGLPRCVSTAEDLQFLLECQPSAANGLTFCTGSLGAHPDNDLPAMARDFGERIHFAHLRNVQREDDGSFFEAAVFEGSTSMVDVVAALLWAEQNGNPTDIPFRADHGHLLDFERAQTTNPGYSYLGRLKGLCELQGIIAGLNHPKSNIKAHHT